MHLPEHNRIIQNITQCAFKWDKSECMTLSTNVMTMMEKYSQIRKSTELYSLHINNITSIYYKNIYLYELT